MRKTPRWRLPICPMLAAAVLVAGCAGSGAAGEADRSAGASQAAGTSTSTSPSTAAAPVVGTGPSKALAAQQVGRFRMEVAGEVVPGRWTLSESRRDVWVAGYYDEVGYSSPALWWGKGTTTHEVPGQRGGVAISRDAHWIAWTRTMSGGYSDLDRPWVMEVVDTATGEVRWSRDADADAPEIGVLAVTNDGVVVFGHCLEPFDDIGGTPQCNDARIDAWAPAPGVAATVPAEVRIERAPPGSVAPVTPLVQVTGAHNGLLVRQTPKGRPRYVHVSERGDVEVVATLPRTTAAVTADGRFALLATECAESSMVCDWSVLPLDGGEPRPLPSLAGLVTIANGYDWPVDPYVIEREDLIVVRDLGDQHYPAVARCNLAQARCVRIEE